MDKKYMALFGIFVLLSSSLVAVLTSNTTMTPKENYDTDEILFNWIEFEKDVNFVYLDFMYEPNPFEESYTKIMPIANLKGIAAQATSIIIKRKYYVYLKFSLTFLSHF